MPNSPLMQSPSHAATLGGPPPTSALFSALEACPEAMAVASALGRIVWGNAAFRALRHVAFSTETAPDSPVGAPTEQLSDLVHSSSVDAVVRLAECAQEDGRASAVVDWRSRDMVRRMEISAHRYGDRGVDPVEEPGSGGIWLIFRDVTEHQLTARLHREATRALALFGETMGAGFWRLELAQRAFELSPTAQRVLGIRAGEAPVPFDDVLVSALPEDAERARAAMDRLAERGGALSDVWTLQDADRPRRVRVEARVLLDGRGRPSSLYGLVSLAPPTARLAAAEAASISDRVRANGLLGGIAAAIAHDINNPLTSVVGNLDLLAEDMRDAGRNGFLSGPAERAELVNEARTGATRVVDIVRSIHRYSTAARAVTPTPDVASAVEAALDLSWGEGRRRAGMERALRPVGGSSIPEPALVRAVVNMVVWASRYTRSGDQPYLVHVSTEQLSDGRPRVVVQTEGTGPVDPRVVSTLGLDAHGSDGLEVARQALAPYGVELRVESATTHLGSAMQRLMVELPLELSTQVAD